MSVLRGMWSSFPRYACVMELPKRHFQHGYVRFVGLSRLSRSYGTLNFNNTFGCKDIISKSKDPSINSKQTNKLFHDQMGNNETVLDKSKLTSLKDQNSNTHHQMKKNSKTFGFHEYEFDENGYMSVDELVKFLRREAAFDISVIKTTGTQQSYVDYLVVVSGVSNRHIRAMSKNLEQLFRGQDVRGVGKDGHVTVEGLSTDNWLALDIGNMAVHFFLPETRALYELEKLWTLGPRYDDQYKALLEEEEFLKAVFVGEEHDSQD